MTRFAAPIFPFLLAAIVSGQTNLLQNSDFESASLSPWSHDGNATHHASIETFDVLGNNTPTRTLACTPYTTRFTLSQPSLVVTGGTNYDFKMDVASFWPNPNNAATQADAGRFTVWVGSQQVHALSLGGVTRANPMVRRRIAITFKAAATGMVDLRIVVHRVYNGLYGRTPRCYVDNVDLRQSPPQLEVRPYGAACGGTKFSATLDQNRANLTLSVETGKPNCVGLMLIGTSKINVPFLGCTLLTDFPFLAPYTLPATGSWSTKVAVPPNLFGKINIQHLVKVPGDEVEATSAVTVGYY